MAFDEELADRIRGVLVDEPDLAEKKMFGGLGFMFEGNMAVAASSRGGLMVRIDPEDAEALLVKPGADRMEMKGRSMNGWLHIDGAALESDDALHEWVMIGLDFAGTLPPK